MNEMGSYQNIYSVLHNEIKYQGRSVIHVVQTSGCISCSYRLHPFRIPGRTRVNSDQSFSILRGTILLTNVLSLFAVVAGAMLTLRVPSSYPFITIQVKSRVESFIMKNMSLMCTLESTESVTRFRSSGRLSFILGYPLGSSPNRTNQDFFPLSVLSKRCR